MMLESRDPKQIYLYDEMPGYIQQMSWSVPYESLILSTLDHDTKTILIKENFYKMDTYLEDSTLFLGAEWTFGEPNKLDKHYFPLQKGLYKYKHPDRK